MAARSGLSLLALVVSLALGCSSSSDAGGGGSPPPAAVTTVTVSAAQPSVVIGTSVQMTSTTLDAAGNVLDRTHLDLEQRRRGGRLGQHQRERDGGVAR